ncbi:hypothetical protein GLAREA_07279 [Glarea lozoyensis ATCC 20868]|uniref:Uncharacterized protein n=1 Tax=Glarea lozoyensis (strain ATCC 20868 / MF5171) TaxID=1116229 RepID=S3DQG3_GLAL2|nr:uncharacterized protein GLAREA_07279 [Glarea lozoyensis ATCC 20868]EPE34266.1 hypothetical protein GLAREA_07279 [Glarea lozoyensis ATCC 20868]
MASNEALCQMIIGENETYLNDIRDWKILINGDGSITNLAIDSYDIIELRTQDLPIREYLARFRLPKQIEDRLPSRLEKIERKELFALGGLTYHLITGKQFFHDVETGLESASIIEKRFVAVTEDRAKPDVTKKKFLLGAQILGGVACLIGALAVPLILPLVGFRSLGVVGGSAATAWQSGIGAVSLFTFLISARAGGAATSAVFIATSVTCASLFVTTTGAGLFDRERSEIEVMGLREHFLAAWRRHIGDE